MSKKEKEKWTLEEAEKHYAKIKNELVVKFSSYYKFTFTFKGEVGEYEFYGYIGGSGGDIYRFEVDTEPIKLPNTLKEVIEDEFDSIIFWNKTHEFKHWSP